MLAFLDVEVESMCAVQFTVCGSFEFLELSLPGSSNEDFTALQLAACSSRSSLWIPTLFVPTVLMRR